MLGMFLSAVVRSFFVILLSHMSKLLGLRFGRAIPFKNDSFSKSHLGTFFLKRFLKNLHMQALISLRSLWSLVSSVKYLTAVSIAFCFFPLRRFFSMLIAITFANGFSQF